MPFYPGCLATYHSDRTHLSSVSGSNFRGLVREQVKNKPMATMTDTMRQVMISTLPMTNRTVAKIGNSLESVEEERHILDQKVRHNTFHTDPAQLHSWMPIRQQGIQLIMQSSWLTLYSSLLGLCHWSPQYVTWCHTLYNQPQCSHWAYTP